MNIARLKDCIGKPKPANLRIRPTILYPHKVDVLEENQRQYEMLGTKKSILFDQGL
jgi:hypothetical protein